MCVLDIWWSYRVAVIGSLVGTLPSVGSGSEGKLPTGRRWVIALEFLHLFIFGL